MSLESDIKSMVESIGLNLYDTAVVTENGETIYRVNLTKEGGITMDMCVEATHLISPLLDVEAPVRGDYRLEVSSPGIERPLKTLSHFQNALGESAKVALLGGGKLRGKLLHVNDKIVTLEDEKTGETSFDFSEVKSAKTFFAW